MFAVAHSRGEGHITVRTRPCWEPAKCLQRRGGDVTGKLCYLNWFERTGTRVWMWCNAMFCRDVYYFVLDTSDNWFAKRDRGFRNEIKYFSVSENNAANFEISI